MKALILCIDEEFMAMQYYTDALETSGYKVVKCENLEQALEAARAERPSLVVLDIMMPAGELYKSEDHHDGLRTGFFVLRDLRTLQAEVPVIVLTNVTDRETLSLFQPGPRLRVFGKPDCPPFELVKQVESMLGSSDQENTS